MLIDFSGSVGFQKEMDKKVWGMYGEVYLRYKWLYYNFDLHILDVLGLQFCALHLPESFSRVMWKNFFSCRGREKLSQFKIGQALGMYDPTKEDVRRAGIVKCIEDFFKYQTEVATNQHFILKVLEIYL